MMGPAAGAPHPLHDGTVTFAAPLAMLCSTASLPRRSVSVGATAAAQLRIVAGIRVPQQGPVSEPVAAAAGTRNSQKNLPERDDIRSAAATKKSRRVFLLDVNPICYDGARPNLHSFAHWLSLFFSQVSLRDPVIAVLDGERGNEYRRQLLPSYKAHRRRFSTGGPHRAELHVSDVLRNCHVPVVKVSGYEADDVVATLADKVLQRGFRVVIASPDKDFKQLISEDVQLVMPMPEFGRWSFYTLRHYMSQYNCDPSSDLSLRCILGDEIDGVPGIQHVVPGFGRKTATKLLKKHGSLENLLNSAAVRTVGKQYAQDALNKYADYLWRNYKVLSLRRDANVFIEKEWLSERDTCSDSAVLSNFVKKLDEVPKHNERYVPSR
uniref:5'-3' exonuclease n=1 Tax=Anthurium amnicola TaxID=1678845 RepID=A0A1D1YEW8_9ARAE